MDYLRSVQREVALATAIFLLGILGGMVTWFLIPASADTTLESAREFVSLFADASPLQLLALIIINNSVKVLAMILFGVFFGLAPMLFLLSNGFVLGIVVLAGTLEHGAVTTIAALVPHGVVEIPAVLFGAAAGLALGAAFARRVRGAEVSVSASARRALAFYGKFVLPLLVLAAFIEVFVTPLFIALFS